MKVQALKNKAEKIRKEAKKLRNSEKYNGCNADDLNHAADKIDEAVYLIELTMSSL